MAIFFDGAFGTYYRALTGSDAPCETANLNDASTVLRIHREYLQAGATAIKTNTFQANPAQFGEAAQWRAVIRRGWALAAQAARPFGAAVFADIGNILSPDAAGDYCRAAREFLDLGAENFLFETLDDFDPLREALALVKSRGARAIVSFAVGQDGYTRAGAHYANLLRAARAAGADVVGLNCVCGPTHMLRLFEALDLSEGAFSAMPNSGYPARVNGRLLYRDNPQYFAERLAALRDLGVEVLGGCCGTTPEHIECAARLIAGRAGAASPRGPRAEQPRSQARESALAQTLFRGARAVVAELNPPIDADASFFLRAAKRLAASGADALTVPDSPLSRPRADSFLMSAKIAREAGVDVLPHLACRDKNAIALQGALIGGNIEGVQNVLAITGDPALGAAAEGERAAGRNVFSLNALKLIGFIKSLNQTLFAARPYLIAAALNVNAPNFQAELDRARAKEDAGAQLLLTQALFTDESLENLRRAREALRLKLLCGILPVAGYKNAVFLNNEVSGIRLPEDFVQSLAGKDREAAAEISLAFSRRVIDRAEPLCDGYYLMTPLKRVDLTEALILYIRGKEDGTR